MRWICSLTLSVLLAGCESFIDPPPSDGRLLLTVDGQCEAGRGANLVIGEAVPFNVPAVPITNVAATLTRPDGQRVPFTRDSLGSLSSDMPLETGAAYALDVTADGFPTAHVECRMPQPVDGWQVEVMGPLRAGGLLPVRVRFQDRPGDDGYVLITRNRADARASDREIYDYATTDPSLSETSFQAAAQEDQSRGYRVFRDRLFNGRTFDAELLVDVSAGLQPGASSLLVIELRSGDRSYYTRERQRIDGDLPPTPFAEYEASISNVQNGIGYVAAIAVRQAVIDLRTLSVP